MAGQGHLEIAKLSAVRTGTAGEFLVASRLIRWGYDVALAPQETPFDLVVTHPTSALTCRAQIKTAAYPNQHGGNGSGVVYKWKTYRSNGGTRTRYKAGIDVDLFFLVALDIERFEPYPMRQKMPVTVSRSRGRLLDNDERFLLAQAWTKLDSVS